jgi:hypothetical protein
MSAVTVYTAGEMKVTDEFSTFLFARGVGGVPKQNY